MSEKSIKGFNECVNKLKQFQKRSTRNRLARAAIKKVGMLLYKAAKKSMINEDRTGLLRKSMGQTTKMYNDTVLAVVGARRNMGGTFVSASGKSYPVKPEHYLHLVELGHGGPHPAKPYPFMRPAFKENEQACKALFAKVLSEEIEKELKKKR